MPQSVDDGPYEGSPPLLVARIAGLPACALAAPGDTALVAVLDRLEAARSELDRARGELAGRLHALIGEPARRDRRFLLTLKRDAFNGRPLAGLEREWDDLPEPVRRIAERALAGERAVASLEGEIDRAYDEHLAEEEERLAEVARRPDFRRGLALASPTLAEELPALERSLAGEPGRRRRRARNTLLRYASRAAFKLTPFSTFTRWTEAGYDPPAAGGEARTDALRLAGDPAGWRQHSLVRTRRYLVEQLAALCERAPEIRRALSLRLNPTLRPDGDGRFTWIAPLTWRPDRPDGASRLRSAGGLPVRVRLDPAVVRWLGETLCSPLPRPRLERALAGILGDGDVQAEESERRAGDLVDRLLALGALVAEPPWHGHETRLEESLLAGLRSAGALPQVAAPLAAWVELERGLPAAADPPAAASAIGPSIEETWAAARRAAGLPESLRLDRHRRSETYEDVALTRTDGAPPVRLRREEIARLLADAGPWHRLGDLFSLRYEGLLSLAALAERHWPGRDEVPALDLFAETLEWWPEVRRAVERPAGWEQGRLPFDPLASPRIAHLAELRCEVWRRLGALAAGGGADVELDPAGVAALTADAPFWCRPPAGPCLFVQPADRRGDRWVLHRLFEGTGRYPMRGLAPLPEATRRDRVRRLVASARDSLPGGAGDAGEPVDLVCTRGDTLSVHEVRTRRALWLPGEPVPVDDGRAVDPAALRVRLDGPLPVLADGDGRRLQPLYLGLATLAYMPPLIAFLSWFGAGEIRGAPVHRTWTAHLGVERSGRVSLGRLIVARRRWRVPAATLAGLLSPPATGRGLATLDRWRSRIGVPRYVFAIEPVRFGERTAFKPQYLDLRSPACCELLAGSLDGYGEAVTLEEMLPGPGAYPRDSAGAEWAVELVIDASCQSPSP